MLMKTRGLFLCIIIFLATLPANGEVGQWKNFTSMKDVSSVVYSNGLVWAATSGGLFAWDEAKDSYQQFTNAEGLKSLDLTALAVDRNGDVWIGSSTGMIHIYSPGSRTWRYVPDIASANQTKKRINSLVIHGDTMLIGTDFGLSVLKIHSLEFGDTYRRFGNLPPSTRLGALSSVIYDNKIWIAITDSGANHRIAFADLSNPNLLAPESWTLESVGLLNNPVRSLLVFQNTLYAGTAQGLYSYTNGLWNSVGSTTGLNIIAMGSMESILAMCSVPGRVDTIGQQQIAGQYGQGLNFSPRSIAFNPSGKPTVGVLDGGVLTSGDPWHSHVPNGPASSQFLQVTVDGDGVLWGASGSTNGKGFYRFNGHNWKSFTRENSALPTNDYYRVSVGDNGSVWASSWGNGVVEVPHGSDSIDASRIYSRNVGMSWTNVGGQDSNSTYVVVSSVLCDNSGNHWMSVCVPGNGRILTVRRRNGTWVHSHATVGSTNIESLFRTLQFDRHFALDAFGNVWGIARQGLNGIQGVISLGNPGVIADSADLPVRFYLNTSDGLPSNDVTTIVIDRDGDLWVGTDRGIMIILDPSNPKRTGGIASYKPLNGLAINTIAVDPINQKWVGTPEGVVVLSQDGTQQIASYNTANTDGKMIDNDVKSIAIDATSGTVYFGTLFGLASLTTAAAAPKQTFDDLRVYPNPFVVPNPGNVTIDGLVGRSSLKILSIDGHLVRDIVTPGGRIGFWDGRNENDDYVASGVYIVVAYSEDGSQTATGKIAVVRR